jgi:hypothetical protein
MNANEVVMSAMKHPQKSIWFPLFEVLLVSFIRDHPKFAIGVDFNPIRPRHWSNRQRGNAAY